jgi:hypothetical protein
MELSDDEYMAQTTCTPHSTTAQQKSHCCQVQHTHRTNSTTAQQHNSTAAQQHSSTAANRAQSTVHFKYSIKHTAQQHRAQQQQNSRAAQQTPTAHSTQTIAFVQNTHTTNRTTSTQGAAGKNEGGARGLQKYKALQLPQLWW